MKWTYKMHDGPTGYWTREYEAKNDEELFCRLTEIMKDMISGRFISVQIRPDNTSMKIIHHQHEK